MPDELLVKAEFVNRLTVLNIVKEMRAGKNTARIFLVEAKEGMGKSWYLTKVKLEHDDLNSAYLDLNNKFIQNPIDLILNMANQLSGEIGEVINQKFQELRTRTVSIKKEGQDQAPKTFNFGDNAKVSKVVGGDYNDIEVSSLGEVEQNAITLYLTEELFKGISKLPAERPALIMFDNYDIIQDSKIDEWLMDLFLPKFLKSERPNSLVLIASESNPELGSDWRLVKEEDELGPFPEKYIREYWVKSRSLPENQVETAAEKSSGIPKLLADYAEEYKREMRRQDGG